MSINLSSLRLYDSVYLIYFLTDLKYGLKTVCPWTEIQTFQPYADGKGVYRTSCIHISKSVYIYVLFAETLSPMGRFALYTYIGLINGVFDDGFVMKRNELMQYGSISFHKFCYKLLKLQNTWFKTLWHRSTATARSYTGFFFFFFFLGGGGGWIISEKCYNILLVKYTYFDRLLLRRFRITQMFCKQSDTIWTYVAMHIYAKIRKWKRRGLSIERWTCRRNSRVQAYQSYLRVDNFEVFSLFEYFVCRWFLVPFSSLLGIREKFKHCERKK